MTYEIFKNRIVDYVSQSSNGALTAHIGTSARNNGLSYDSLSISEKETYLSPVIIIKPYYDMLECDDEFDRVADKILAFYNENKKRPTEDYSFFLDFEKVKDRIVFRLVNRAANAERLKDVPYIPYLDLAIIFYYYFDNPIYQDTSASVLITNRHINFWDTSAAELYSIALANTPKILGFETMDLFDILLESSKGMLIAEEVDLREFTNKMFVLSNKTRNYGAAVCLYKDALRDFAIKINCDFFIIPSSVHEIILIPATECELECIESMREIIRYVNLTEVDAVDVLSNNMYLYTRDDNRIRIC